MCAKCMYRSWRNNYVLDNSDCMFRPTFVVLLIVILFITFSNICWKKQTALIILYTQLHKQKEKYALVLYSLSNIMHVLIAQLGSSILSVIFKIIYSKQLMVNALEILQLLDVFFLLSASEIFEQLNETPQ